MHLIAMGFMLPTANFNRNVLRGNFRNMYPLVLKEISLKLPPPPYFIEIGSGVGFHAIQRSLMAPNANYIAIERNRTRFEKFLRRIENHKEREILPLKENLIPVRADAIPWICRFIPENSVKEYFFLYPNPFPRKNRWHRNKYFLYILHTLQEGGEISFASNIKEYMEEAKFYCEQKYFLSCVEYRKIDPKEKPRTHFEKKYLARREDCWNLRFKKIKVS